MSISLLAVPHRLRPHLLAGTAVAAILLASVPASALAADRFGEPTMDTVSAPQTTLYAGPDRSQPIGPLPNGATVISLGEQGDMTHTPDGWVAASDIQERTEPWIAEVSVDSVSIYAKPNAQGDVRRTAQRGDLLRVMGVSPGVEGDTGTWWATTEGYVDLHAIRAATSEWAQRGRRAPRLVGPGRRCERPGRPLNRCPRRGPV